MSRLEFEEKPGESELNLKTELLWWCFIQIDNSLILSILKQGGHGLSMNFIYAILGIIEQKNIRNDGELCMRQSSLIDFLSILK